MGIEKRASYLFVALCTSEVLLHKYVRMYTHIHVRICIHVCGSMWERGPLCAKCSLLLCVKDIGGHETGQPSIL